MKGKLLVIEGTDCSGKETQSKMLASKLNEMGIETRVFSFPIYDSPTGRIFGTCYLGKEEMCNEHLCSGDGWFEEGAVNVDPMVASLYAAADRKYNIKIIEDLLDSGVNVILDRYIYSNMAHQACKINDNDKALAIINKLELLEFGILELPKPDVTMLLYVPVDVVQYLKKNREEKADQHEIDSEYLARAERTYLLLKDMYKFNLIECACSGKIRTIEDINNELLDKVMELIKVKDYSRCKRNG